MEEPDPKNNVSVRKYLMKFIYEHPDTVIMAYMRCQNEWWKWLWDNSPSDLLRLYREIAPRIDQVKIKEIKRRALSPTSQGLYQRQEWPRTKRLPAYNWPNAKCIASDVYAQLIKLPYTEALDFFSELIVAWFYSCPEVLLKLDSAYPIKFPDPATDIEYVNVLWNFYYEYITDFRHAKYTREDFENQIELVRNRKKPG